MAQAPGSAVSDAPSCGPEEQARAAPHRLRNGGIRTGSTDTSAPRGALTRGQRADRRRTRTCDGAPGQHVAPARRAGRGRGNERRAVREGSRRLAAAADRIHRPVHFSIERLFLSVPRAVRLVHLGFSFRIHPRAAAGIAARRQGGWCRLPVSRSRNRWRGREQHRESKSEHQGRLQHRNGRSRAGLSDTPGRRIAPPGAT